MAEAQYQYDVALSFAGEDRDYVDQVAECLRAAGVKVFYDNYEKVELWGEDLYQRLDDVYRRQARYCAIFASAAYRDKVWTKHELRSAQARALESHGVYILPARFDDTQIPGIVPTTMYVDLQTCSPEEFAEMVKQKIGNVAASGAVPEPDDDATESGFRRPKLGGRGLNPYDEGLSFIDSLTSELKHRCDALAGDDVSSTLFDRKGRKCLRVVIEGKTEYSFDVWLGGMMDDDTINFYGVQGEMRSSENTSNAWGDVVWDRERGAVALRFHDLSLLSIMGAGEDRLFAFPEFTDALWDVICDVLEKVR